MNFLNKITYRPGVLRLAQTLRLRKIARTLYYHWARPKDGVLRMQIGPSWAQFHVHTPEELRLLESAGGGEHQILELLISSVHAGDTVYDIGANVGLYTVLLAKAVGEQGQVVAFEPEPNTFSHLEENVRLNGLQNVRCIGKALGDLTGLAKLYSSPIIGNTSLMAPVGGNGSGEIVDVEEGDRLVAAEQLRVPRLVKIDVEGYEYAVLRGLRDTLANPHCELVCCEVHPHLLPEGVQAEKISSLLRESGFTRSETYPRWDGTFHLVCYKAPSRPGT